MGKQLKIAILGQRSVGKSALTLQFVEGKFYDSYNPTTKNELKIFEDHSDSIILIDTPGQNEFIFSEEFNNVNAWILVYDVNSSESINAVKRIYHNLFLLVKKNPISLLLIGNKKDVNKREVSWEEGIKLATDWKASFYEVTAKEQIVKQIFYYFISRIKVEESEIDARFDATNNKIDSLGARVDSLSSRMDCMFNILKALEVPNNAASVQTPTETGTPAEASNTRAPTPEIDNIAGPSNEEQDERPSQQILSPPLKKRKLEPKSVSVKKVLMTYIDFNENRSEPKVQFKLDVEENSIKPIRMDYKNIRRAKAIK